MIKYVKHHFIDRQKYDHCVRMDTLGLVYGFSWYLDAVCENWDALVLDDYAAVWPLPVKRKWGVKYFYRPYAVQQLGVFSKKKLDENGLLEFIKAMQRNCHFAEVFLNENQLADFNQLQHTGIALQLNLTIDLAVSYRELYHRFKGHSKRNIKDANKNELQLFEHDSPELLIGIFRETKGESLGLQEGFYRNMKKAMYQCLHRGVGKTWTVYGPHNSVCAGAFFVETEKRHTLLFTALTAEGKKLGAMYYLINEYLIYQSAKPKIFDFEGSNNPGVANFYSSFGAEKVHYPALVYNNLPWPLSWLKSRKA